MKKKIFMYALLLTISIKGVAQQVVTAPKLEAQTASSNALQRALQAIEKENLLNTIDIKRYQEIVSKYTKDYHEALKVISDKLMNARQINEIYDLQKKYVTSHYANILKIGNKMKGTERENFLTVMRSGLKLSFKKSADLKIILTSNYYKMSDDERLRRIEEIRESLYTFYEGMVAYCKEVYQAVVISTVIKK